MKARLRAADLADAGGMGDILWDFQDQNDWMPDLYPRGELIRYSEQMARKGWVTVALYGESLAGFIARDGEEICALYVRPGLERQGIGKQLIDFAKSECESLWLRCLVPNAAARRFYCREGFSEIDRGDGDENDEGLPEVTYGWALEPAT